MPFRFTIKIWYYLILGWYIYLSEYMWILYQYSTECDNRFACYPGINVSENITTLKKALRGLTTYRKRLHIFGVSCLIELWHFDNESFRVSILSWSHGANIWEQRCKNYCTYFLCPKTSSNVVRICDLWCFSVPMSCWRHNLQVIINTVCSRKKKIQNVPLEV